MRTKAMRRHHARRLKVKRSKYHNTGARTPTHIGKCYATPCFCSCHMCGHKRYHQGPSQQERLARLRFTD